MKGCGEMVTFIGEAGVAKKQAVCMKCDARIEYTRSEVREYHGKDWSGGADGKEWINCPRCGGEVILRAW